MTQRPFGAAQLFVGEKRGAAPLFPSGVRRSDCRAFPAGVDIPPLGLECQYGQRKVRQAEEVEATLRGDGEAYARLVDRYKKPVADGLWRFTRNRRQREELVQDVFVEAFLSLATYEGRAPILNWLRRIATRTGYRHWRERRRRRTETPWDWRDEDAAQRPAHRAAAAQAAADTLEALLRRLSAHDRRLLTLLHLDGLPVAEAARLTGLSPPTLRVQAHRARKRLRRLAEQSEDG